MELYPTVFEHHANCLDDIKNTLGSFGVRRAVLKQLPKNANDKNQIYISTDFGVLSDDFSMTFNERGASISEKEFRKFRIERSISEAAFDQFSWLKVDGSLSKAKKVKAIIYPQYPEVRLSGFLTVENTMPGSLSVSFTKKYPDARRLLVLGVIPGGSCIAIVYSGLSNELVDEIKALPSHERAKACKLIDFGKPGLSQLFALLKPLVGRRLPGCRLNSMGATLPFTGTQVCGYTLEHGLGIASNSDKEGDIFGIELKTHTSRKLTLFTPEPDFGFYAENFTEFMNRFGYLDSQGDRRLTGLHRANIPCVKTGLVLKVTEFRVDSEGQWILDDTGERVRFPYDESSPLSAKTDGLQVVLLDVNGFVAAGWSFARLMNSWGAKHNEVVYIPSQKTLNDNPAEVERGYDVSVMFSPTVMLCQRTSAERLYKAINDGVVFLDPAPKLHATDSSKHKRRAQWRVNDIAKAALTLYESMEFVTLK
ncbi:hypothetical protein PSCICJ_09800 [Pseudomonas cichorii]|uniref:MvaI/BcnI family restriction endonuclease n=1 Tax=Pseudomonas cichorii TaxID=36746 RepID=UPI0019107063|nr:MvaI/BcnI family restriction endonuclease [Pseudomonas cichorii]GFM64862.1 hypothetical protein PSCICJ_09800 [Pseudomonas cichorii]